MSLGLEVQLRPENETFAANDSEKFSSAQNKSQTTYSGRNIPTVKQQFQKNLKFRACSNFSLEL